MNLISREELKQKLESGEDVKLVMTMHELAFQEAHLPGSLNIYRLEDALSILKPQDEIVVYCSHQICVASIMAYQLLRQHGYQKVRRYAGGLNAWAEAGYPLASLSGTDLLQDVSASITAGDMQ